MRMVAGLATLPNRISQCLRQTIRSSEVGCEGWAGRKRSSVRRIQERSGSSTACGGDAYRHMETKP